MSVRTVKSNAMEFAQCTPQTEKFVTVPQIEHILVQQPVTYKQYKQKVTYMQVPVPQSYTKVTLQSQEQGCQAQQAQQAYIPTAAATSKPVYGCCAGPFEQASWDSTLEGVTDNGPFGALAMNPDNFYYAGPQVSQAPVFAPRARAPAPRVTSYAALY